MAGVREGECCAAVPEAGLALLAGLRTRAGVRVLVREGRAWVYWPAGEVEVLHRVLAIEGAEVFARRGGLWYRPGQHLPAFGVPEGEDARPLVGVLTPAPVCPEMAGATQRRRVDLKLVRDETHRPATALECSLAELGRWAEQATTRQLAALEAAWESAPHDSGAARVLLLGQQLPPLADGRRFWGRTVLVPLGFRPEPALAEGALREALGLGPEEWALVDGRGVEVVPCQAFRPLTRAGVRLALEVRM